MSGAPSRIRLAICNWHGLRFQGWAISGRAYLRPEWNQGWLVRVLWKGSPFLLYRECGEVKP